MRRFVSDEEIPLSFVTGQGRQGDFLLLCGTGEKRLRGGKDHFRELVEN